MTARTRVTATIAAAAAVAGLMAGCGGGDDATERSGAGATASPNGVAAGTTPATPTTGPDGPDGGGGSGADSARRQPPARGAVRTVASGLAVPWDIEFLPDGDALATERDSARIVRVPAEGGTPRTVMTVPGVVPGGEGGLLGLAVSPSYRDDSTIYVYFTAERDNRIARINLATKQVTPILTGLRKAQIHNGGALSFGPDGRLYAGVGETGDTALAQDRDSRNGKVLRITTTGKAPSDNPIDGSPIWTLGHRNVQGLTWDAQGRMWASEFGQNTTDEVNLIRKGHNYGWPIVEGKGDTQSGRFTNPVVTWSPTSESSPSGAAISGQELYVSALAGRRLWRIRLDGTSAGQPEALFTGRFGRIRAVAAAPDGSIWFSTSNRDGRGNPSDGDDRLLQLGT